MSQSELPVDRAERRFLARARRTQQLTAELEAHQRTVQGKVPHVRIGPGHLTAESRFHRWLKHEARLEIRLTGKLVKTPLILQRYRANDEAWMAQLKKRNTWRASQGLPLIHRKEGE